MDIEWIRETWTEYDMTTFLYEFLKEESYDEIDDHEINDEEFDIVSYKKLHNQLYNLCKKEIKKIIEDGNVAYFLENDNILVLNF